MHERRQRAFRKLRPFSDCLARVVQRGEIDPGQAEELDAFFPGATFSLDLPGMTVSAALIETADEHQLAVDGDFMASRTGFGRRRRHGRVQKMFLEMRRVVELQPRAAN